MRLCRKRPLYFTQYGHHYIYEPIAGRYWSHLENAHRWQDLGNADYDDVKKFLSSGVYIKVKDLTALPLFPNPQ